MTAIIELHLTFGALHQIASGGHYHSHHRSDWQRAWHSLSHSDLGRFFTHYFSWINLHLGYSNILNNYKAFFNHPWLYTCDSDWHYLKYPKVFWNAIALAVAIVIDIFADDLLQGFVDWLARILADDTYKSIVATAASDGFAEGETAGMPDAAKTGDNGVWGTIGKYSKGWEKQDEWLVDWYRKRFPVFDNPIAKMVTESFAKFLGSFTYSFGTSSILTCLGASWGFRDQAVGAGKTWGTLNAVGHTASAAAEGRGFFGTIGNVFLHGGIYAEAALISTGAVERNLCKSNSGGGIQ